MANRFIDTRFFKSPFVRSLQAPSKLLYTFIICECSPAGIWEKDLEAATLYTGTQQSEEDFAAFVSTGRAIEFQPGRIFFPDFILHQYPSGLQRQNPAHKNVIAELLKFNLLIENNEGALKPLESPLKGSKVIDKVTVKEKDKVKDTTQSREKKNETVDLAYPYTGEKFMQVWNELIRGPKWKRKTKSALQASLIQIGEYSEGNEATAIQIMMNSLAGNWQGVFPIDRKNQHTMTNGREKTDASIAAKFVSDTNEAIRIFRERHQG